MLMLSGNAEADALLDESDLALLIGMLLDQQFPMERAFFGPYEIQRRTGAALDVGRLASADPEELATLFARPPAVHRYPGSMAQRVQGLCRHLLERYDGDAGAVWRDAVDGGELLRRLTALPGFGRQKAQIFLALLGKQRGVAPPGWQEAAGLYAEPGVHRSVADITDRASLEAVRAYKQEAKRKAKQEAAPPTKESGAAGKSGPASKKSAPKGGPRARARR